jgi:integrase
MFGRNINSHSVNIHVFKPTLINAGLSPDRSCKDTRSSYIPDHHILQTPWIIMNGWGLFSNRSDTVQPIGHSTTKMIVEHYYNHIPAPDDGKGLEKAFADTIAVDDLTPETTK